MEISGILLNRRMDEQGIQKQGFRVQPAKNPEKLGIQVGVADPESIVP